MEVEPDPIASASASSVAELAADGGRGELHRAIAGLEGKRLPRAATSPLYGLGMFLVAFAMLLLPLVYIGLVGVVAYLVYRLPTDTPEWAQDDYGDFGIFAIIVTVIGVIFVIFMIKPLFARPEKAPKLYKLKPGEAPELEDFVNRVADTVGAARPREIEVNCDVNAAAGFRRGLWSLLGRDLKLIIGLPLMAGMSARSFGGVLAHEFGHFSQGAGMRLTYIIRVINAWLMRLVYQRDRLDAWLDGLARTIDLRIGVILWTAKLLIWISRRVLWLLMYLGHGISCFALRQMEFDADRYEAGFAGSDQFAKTSRQLQKLGIGAGRSMELLQETWQQGRISRNYPELTRRQTERLPDEVEKALDEALSEEKTGLLDTHPCDAERIAAAEELAVPGIFTLEVPAGVLMEDFDELCRRVTLDFYTIEQGLELQDHNLIANDVIGADDEMMDREIKAINGFFGEQLSFDRPVFVQLASVTSSTGDAGHARELCGRVKPMLESLEEEFKGFGERVEKRNNLWAAEILKDAGFSLEPKNVGLEAADLVSLSNNLRICETAIVTARSETFAGFDSNGREALIEALAVARRSGGENALAVDSWLGWLTFFEEVYPDLMRLKKLVMQQGVLIHNVGDEGVHDQHLKQMQALKVKQQKLIVALKDRLSSRIYPFTHAEGEVSVWNKIDPKPPQEADVIVQKQIIAEALVNQLLRLYQRTLGQLAMLAEQAIGEGGSDSGSEEKGDEAASAGSPQVETSG